MRMGRESEALPLLDAVLDESPTDESTLQAMNIAYKELQQRECLPVVSDCTARKAPLNKIRLKLGLKSVMTSFGWLSA